MIWAIQERGWTRRHVLEAASGAALPLWVDALLA